MRFKGRGLLADDFRVDGKALGEVDATPRRGCHDDRHGSEGEVSIYCAGVVALVCTPFLLAPISVHPEVGIS